MNDNCLAGVKCPTCGSSEPFIIEVKHTTLMYDDGSDPAGKYDTGMEWDNDSFIRCRECGEEGVVGEFTVLEDLPESSLCETNSEPTDTLEKGEDMIKYAVPDSLVQDLIDLNLCETEEDAREKVASGEASDLIKEAKLKILAREGLYEQNKNDTKSADSSDN